MQSSARFFIDNLLQLFTGGNMPFCAKLRYPVSKLGCVFARAAGLRLINQPVPPPPLFMLRLRNNRLTAIPHHSPCMAECLINTAAARARHWQCFWLFFSVHGHGFIPSKGIKESSSLHSLSGWFSVSPLSLHRVMLWW